MIPLQVTLVPLIEKPEKLMGPEWRKEGPGEELPGNSGIVIHAEADEDGEKESKNPSR